MVSNGQLKQGVPKLLLAHLDDQCTVGYTGQTDLIYFFAEMLLTLDYINHGKFSS